MCYRHPGQDSIERAKLRVAGEQLEADPQVVARGLDERECVRIEGGEFDRRDTTAAAGIDVRESSWMTSTVVVA